MAALRNSKHERFCQLRLEGKTLEQAYAGAGYNPSKPAASRMAKLPEIVQRMHELHVHALNKADVTVETIAAQLDADVVCVSVTLAEHVEALAQGLPPDRGRRPALVLGGRVADRQLARLLDARYAGPSARAGVSALARLAA